MVKSYVVCIFVIRHHLVTTNSAENIRLDTIGLAGFAYDFQTLDPSKPQHPLARVLDGLTDSSGTHSFSAFLVHAFIWAFPAILRIPSKRQQALAKSRMMLGKITDQVWQERKKAGQSDQEDTGKSILELLLKAERPGAANNLTQQQIAAEVGFSHNQPGMLLLKSITDDDIDFRRI